MSVFFLRPRSRYKKRDSSLREYARPLSTSSEAAIRTSRSPMSHHFAKSASRLLDQLPPRVAARCRGNPGRAIRTGCPSPTGSPRALRPGYGRAISDQVFQHPPGWVSGRYWLPYIAFGEPSRERQGWHEPAPCPYSKPASRRRQHNQILRTAPLWHSLFLQSYADCRRLTRWREGSRLRRGPRGQATVGRIWMRQG